MVNFSSPVPSPQCYLLRNGYISPLGRKLQSGASKPKELVPIQPGLKIDHARYINREVKLDVYGKRQTTKMKLSPSVFSSLYSGMKLFVFHCAVNSKRHFLFLCGLLKDYKKRPGGVLPIMAYTGRLRPKGVPFSGFRYKKG